MSPTLSPASDFTLVQGQLSAAAVAGIQDSFNALPKDPYIQGDFRYRCYSNVKLVAGQVQRLPTKSFMQSSDINQYLGDVERRYEEIPDATLHGEAMVAMLEGFQQECGLSDEAVIEIHQIRIKTESRNATPPAPEGVHQDGFDFLGVYVLGTGSVEGGELMLYEAKDAAPFFCERFADGQYVVLNDARYFHNAAPVIPLEGQQLGYWDVVVLTAHAA
ncbi:2OG-Fe dioxygenase family protein [Gallaecimonas kandeliae]|uniref:2OG-Fe dioxygenase family protein n=1 Tax=Gallaecimonas kandeliae TaxID=3029055 RepID=UPI002649E546|nr:2OG-Fe dioxygenase family protein [Gallaecimonas kandeliae]WKE66870.1 2OG-Fe dioxygenase family protein [Gallaecimonas kandeliae]